MKIVYDDIIFSLQKSGGVSVVWSELLKRAPEDAIHILYDNAEQNQFYDKDKEYNPIIRSSKGLVFQRYMNIRLKSNKPFIFHSSYYRYCTNANAINVTTVHDFTYEYYRKDIASNLHKRQKKNAVMHSKGVVCISENTKKDLLKFYPDYQGKIKVIYNAYDKNSYYQELNLKHSADILFVGGRAAYKRFDLAVEIVRKLPKTRLAIVGGGDLTTVEKNQLEKELSGRYIFKGRVPNDELRHLYGEALCTCYMSDYEGFGLPIIEAQACGCPVVCQRNSSLTEVGRDSVIYFDKNNIENSVDEISKLTDPKYYFDIQIKGLENCKRFSWDKSAHEVFEFYKELYQDSIIR